MSQLVGFADNEIVKGKARVQRRPQIIAPAGFGHIGQGRAGLRRRGSAARCHGFLFAYFRLFLARHPFRLQFNINTPHAGIFGFPMIANAGQIMRFNPTAHKARRHMQDDTAFLRARHFQ